MPDIEKKPRELVAHSASSDGVVVDTLQRKYSIAQDDMQSLYSEVRGEKGNEKSRNRSFEYRKMKSQLLVESYSRLSKEYDALKAEGLSDAQILEQFGLLPSFFERMSAVDSCGVYISFRIPVTGGKWKLHRANFCHDRLCPLCMARRSLKIYSQLNSILNYVDHEKYEYLFLTVTVPNCEGPDLDSVCDRILKSFTKMMRRKELKSLVKGYFRSLEVTFNHRRYSKSFMTFHPHLHAILAVPKSYFKKYYIKQSDWLRMWQECYGDDSIQFVNIKKIYAAEQEMSECADLVSIALHKAVAETGKYSVKYSDYLFGNNPVLTDYAVKHLARALKGQRLFAYAGIFKDAFVALNQEDVMSDKADLVHINSDDIINPELAYHVVTWKWGGGMYRFFQYELAEGNGR